MVRIFFASPVAGFGISSGKMAREACGRDWRGYPARGKTAAGPCLAERREELPPGKGRPVLDRGVARKARLPPQF